MEKTLSDIVSKARQVDQILQNNAASAEECAASARELNAQAEAMRSSVSEFQVLMGTVEAAGTVRTASKGRRQIPNFQGRAELETGASAPNGANGHAFEVQESRRF